MNSLPLLVTIKQYEQQIETIYQLLVYAVPLVSAVLVAYMGIYFRLRQLIKSNTRKIDLQASMANGKLDRVSQQVEDLHEQVTGAPSGDGATGGIGPGSAADGAGAAVSPSVAPIHSVDVQPPQ